MRTNGGLLIIFRERVMDQRPIKTDLSARGNHELLLHFPSFKPRFDKFELKRYLGSIFCQIEAHHGSYLLFWAREVSGKRRVRIHCTQFCVCPSPGHFHVNSMLMLLSCRVGHRAAIIQPYKRKRTVGKSSIKLALGERELGFIQGMSANSIKTAI